MNTSTVLTPQEFKVYKYISENRGCTTRDIINATYITCPSGRITEMRAKGVPIISIGQKKYEGARAFEMYAIEEPKPIVLPKEELPAQQLSLV